MSVVWTGGEVSGELSRRASSKDRILAALQAAGPRGVTNGTLNDISFRYGARILELRKSGHHIDSLHEKDGSWRFVLRPSAPPAAPGRLF